MEHTVLTSIVEWLKRRWYVVLALIVVAILLVTGPLLFTYATTRGRRYDLSKQSVSSVPINQVGIVFGAGILPNGQPTTYLQYRLDTAVSLYKAHKIKVLLMSGDNSVVTHNEPLVMKNYAHKHGVPTKAIVVDDAGFDTYDTCYRAGKIFGVKKATLIAQGYFLPRAMTTCAHLGVANIGVASIHPAKDYTSSYIAREFLSTDKMVFQLLIHSTPKVLGQPQPISSP